MIHIDLFACQYADSLVRKREELARQTRWNLTKDRKTKTKKKFDIVISSSDVKPQRGNGQFGQ